MPCVTADSTHSPPTRVLRIFATVGALSSLVGLTACGDMASSARPGAAIAAGAPDLPASDVARVGHHVITKAALEHWTAVEGVLSYRNPPSRPVPRGWVPDPPGFRNCITYLASIRSTSTGKLRPTAAPLKAQCIQRYERLHAHVLEILITNYWAIEEATDNGLRVRTPEIQHALDLQFASTAGLHRYLALTGERETDLRFLAEGRLLLEKLQWRVNPLRGHKGPESPAVAAEVDVSIAKFEEEMHRKWAPRTDCRVGYVSPLCAQFGARRP